MNFILIIHEIKIIKIHVKLLFTTIIIKYKYLLYKFTF